MKEDVAVLCRDAKALAEKKAKKEVAAKEGAQAIGAKK